MSLDADATPLMVQTYGTLSNNPISAQATQKNKDGLVVINFDQPGDRLHTSMGDIPLSPPDGVTEKTQQKRKTVERTLSVTTYPLPKTTNSKRGGESKRIEFSRGQEVNTSLREPT